MVVLDNALICGGNGISRLFLLEKRSTRTCSIVGFAKKNNSFSENATAQQLKLPRTLIAQTAIGVFALGFVDAGYSGDWSRIEVISRETEDFLKVAAFFVVPFCFFLVLWLFNKQSEE